MKESDTTETEQQEGGEGAPGMPTAEEDSLWLRAQPLTLPVDPLPI